MKNKKLQFQKGLQPRRDDTRALVGKMKFKVHALKKSVEQDEVFKKKDRKQGSPSKSIA